MPIALFKNGKITLCQELVLILWFVDKCLTSVPILYTCVQGCVGISLQSSLPSVPVSPSFPVGSPWPLRCALPFLSPSVSPFALPAVLFLWHHITSSFVPIFFAQMSSSQRYLLWVPFVKFQCWPHPHSPLFYILVCCHFFSPLDCIVCESRRVLGLIPGKPPALSTNGGWPWTSHSNSTSHWSYRQVTDECHHAWFII